MSNHKKSTRESRKYKFILFVFLFTFFLFESVGQEITKEDFNKVDGIWEGFVSYTDYGDDKTQYRLETKLIATAKDGSVKLKFEYKEPNGKIVTDSQKMKYLTSKEVFLNGKFQILQQSKTDGEWEIVVEETGKDNNKPSTIRYIVSATAKEFSIIKMVRYQGTAVFFKRNQHVFNR